MHSMFGIKVNNTRETMYNAVRSRLLQQLRRTMVLIIDERSMISAENLGAAARNTKETAHGGVNYDLSWGGIPVVILFGDDHQLPPVEGSDGKGKGAFYVLDGSEKSVNKNWGSNVETLGYSQFLELAMSVKKLTTLERQDESNREHVHILSSLRPPKTLDEDQVNKLLSLDIRHQPTTIRDHIIDNAMHIYANKDKARDWNNFCIANKSSEDNPIAIIKANGESSVSSTGKAILNHYNRDQIKTTATIFVGEKVSLNGKNLLPEWGLFNGAIGTVEEIVFADGDNPNDNDQPIYIAVRFENYTGPVWDAKNPKTVPIPIITVQCQKKCCHLRICPLTPAYATTVHKFQGQSCGPTKPGKPTNEVQVNVCCPGSKLFEALNPGTLYTIISRATTLGDNSNKGSAIYFIGENINRDRFTDIHKKRDGKVYEKVKRREKWISYLEARCEKTKRAPANTVQLEKWTHEKRYTIPEIQETIDSMATCFAL